MFPLNNNRRVGNINAYQHFFIGGGHIVDPELEWMVDLRKPIKTKNFLTKSTNQEPKFYSQDLEKYKERLRQAKLDKDILSSPINIARSESIVRNPFNQVDGTQIRFGFALRTCDDKHDWAPNNSPTKSMIDKFLPPIKAHSKGNLNKIKDYLSRPKVNVTEVIFYNF
jgi:hypothetical protein